MNRRDGLAPWMRASCSPRTWRCVLLGVALAGALGSYFWVNPARNTLAGSPRKTVIGEPSSIVAGIVVEMTDAWLHVFAGNDGKVAVEHSAEMRPMWLAKNVPIANRPVAVEQRWVWRGTWPSRLADSVDTRRIKLLQMPTRGGIHLRLRMQGRALRGMGVGIGGVDEFPYCCQRKLQYAAIHRLDDQVERGGLPVVLDAYMERQGIIPSRGRVSLEDDADIRSELTLRASSDHPPRRNSKYREDDSRNSRDLRPAERGYTDHPFDLYACGVLGGLLFGFAGVQQFDRDRKRIGAALLSVSGVGFLAALGCVIWGF